jgi:predicted N-formylglutamate amidohydrolase
LDDQEKQKLINAFYLPYRSQVENEIRVSQKPVLHLSIHSFTPIWNGVERDVDIGLLFDPGRKLESTFCQHYEQVLNEVPPQYRIQFNKPYLGIDDGFTTYLRTKFQDNDYAGIEIEINQKFVPTQEEIAQKLLSGLKKVAHN